MARACSTGSGRRIELTEAGRLFLPEARAVLAAAEAAARVLSEIGGLARGSLHIEASQTIASYWLPRHLVAFRRAFPAIDVSLSIGNTAQVAEGVEAGRAALGFIEGAIDSPHLDARPIARDQLTLIVGAGHPWAARTGFPRRSSAPANGCCAKPAPARARPSRRRCAGSASIPPPCASSWRCPPTRPCARRSRPAWAPARCPPRWRRQALKPACCMSCRCACQIGPFTR